MTRLLVHYHPETGELRQVSIAPDTFNVSGIVCGWMEAGSMLEILMLQATHRVDLASVIPPDDDYSAPIIGQLIEK